MLQERSLVHSAKATRAKRCTQISIQKARAPSTLFESRFSRFRGRVARGCGSARPRPLLILRVAFDASGASTYRVAVPSRSSTRQFGRSMVLICTRAGARPRGAILESECQIASLLALGVLACAPAWRGKSASSYPVWRPYRITALCELYVLDTRPVDLYLCISSLDVDSNKAEIP